MVLSLVSDALTAHLALGVDLGYGPGDTVVTAAVTGLNDAQLRDLAAELDRAGVGAVLVDDRPTPRPGTTRGHGTGLGAALCDVRTRHAAN